MRCVVAAVAAAIALGGCSFAWVDTVAQPDPKAEPQCTSWNVAPVLDLAMVAMGAWVTVAAVFEARDRAEADGEDPDGAWGMAAAGAVGTAPWAASATYGFWQTARCRRARAEHRARLELVAAPAK